VRLVSILVAGHNNL